MNEGRELGRKKGWTEGERDTGREEDNKGERQGGK